MGHNRMSMEQHTFGELVFVLPNRMRAGLPDLLLILDEGVIDFKCKKALILRPYILHRDIRDEIGDNTYSC
jgi:hypothetical protein